MASSNPSIKHLLLLTGVPGIGKTTLMSKLQKTLSQSGITCSGFITEEVRSGGKRIGFDVITMDGQRGQLSRVSDQSSSMLGQREYRVGQYKVNLMSFEQTALPTLQLQNSAGKANTVILVDEIGKMELFSDRFIQAVRKLLSQPNTTIVATIPVPKGRPLTFVEELRSSPKSQVFEVSRENRDTLLEDLVTSVKASVEMQVKR